MKGIILAGGQGTRLFPITQVVSKQLLPVYNKPMIYYPLSVLMLAGIRDILIISTPADTPRFKDLLGNGSSLGISLTYAVQSYPRGLADSFIIGEDFIGDDSVALILGDNIFYGPGLSEWLVEAASLTRGATIFGYHVKDPQRFGIVGFDESGKVTSIEEKPSQPRSNYAITGLYFYDNRVINFAKSLFPSERGELEITDINKIYLDLEELDVRLMGRGFSWLDSGTHESLLEASQFIETIEKRQGLKIACLEEIAYSKRYISKEQLLSVAETMKKNEYGQYLLRLVEA